MIYSYTLLFVLYREAGMWLMDCPMYRTAVHRQYCMKLNTRSTRMTCTYPYDTHSLKTVDTLIERESLMGLS